MSKEVILQVLKTILLKKYKSRKSPNSKILLREVLLICLRSSKRKMTIRSQWQVMLRKPKV